MKIAVAQISCTVGDVAANLRTMEQFSSRAKQEGADLIVFPEMVDTGYSMRAIQAHATAWSEGAVPALQHVARKLSLAILCGVSERAGSCIYNSQVFIDRTGELIGKYRKAHLFTPAPIEEHKCFACGDELAAVDFAGLRFGFGICYDLRFPEVYRHLAVHEHANAFILSSAWPFPRVEHLRTLALARAIENQSYMMVANRVGTYKGVTFCGSSAIIDPYGVLLASASADREEIICATLSPEVVEQVRSRMPVFAHRREELYGRRAAPQLAPS